MLYLESLKGGVVLGRYLDAARMIGDWFIANQVHPVNRDSADVGRYPFQVDSWNNATDLASSWNMGTIILSMLALWRATKDKRYLNSALLAGGYLKTLSILDPRDKKIFGAIRERSAQTDWLFPRDGASGAWGDLALFDETGDAEYLYRSELYARWQIKHGRDRAGWPYFTYYLDGRPPRKTRGGFQAGAGVYFYHLYRVTGKKLYLTRGLKPLADGFLRWFLAPDGSLRQAYEPGKRAFVDAGYAFHNYNDDFSNLALLCAYDAFKDGRYLEGARRFANWMVSEQRKDGHFGEVPSASATGIILFSALDRIRKEPKLMRAARRAARWILSRQVTDTEDPKRKGGIRGQDMSGRILAARLGAYAISALLALDDRRHKNYYSVRSRLRKKSR